MNLKQDIWIWLMIWLVLSITTGAPWVVLGALTFWIGLCRFGEILVDRLMGV